MIFVPVVLMIDVHLKNGNTHRLSFIAALLRMYTKAIHRLPPGPQREEIFERDREILMNSGFEHDILALARSKFDVYVTEEGESSSIPLSPARARRQRTEPRALASERIARANSFKNLFGFGNGMQVMHSSTELVGQDASPSQLPQSSNAQFEPKPNWSGSIVRVHQTRTCG